MNSKKKTFFLGHKAGSYLLGVYLHEKKKWCIQGYTHPYEMGLSGEDPGEPPQRGVLKKLKFGPEFIPSQEAQDPFFKSRVEVQVIGSYIFMSTG